MSKRKLWQANIQQRVRVTLLVLGSLISLKAHVPVEADSLRVLLVDGDLADAVLQELPAKSPAALQCKDISDQKSG